MSKDTKTPKPVPLSELVNLIESTIDDMADYESIRAESWPDEIERGELVLVLAKALRSAKARSKAAGVAVVPGLVVNAAGDLELTEEASNEGGIWINVGNMVIHIEPGNYGAHIMAHRQGEEELPFQTMFVEKPKIPRPLDEVVSEAK